MFLVLASLFTLGFASKLVSAASLKQVCFVLNFAIRFLKINARFFFYFIDKEAKILNASTLLCQENFVSSAWVILCPLFVDPAFALRMVV